MRTREINRKGEEKKKHRNEKISKSRTENHATPVEYVQFGKFIDTTTFERDEIRNDTQADSEWKEFGKANKIQNKKNKYGRVRRDLNRKLRLCFRPNGKSETETEMPKKKTKLMNAWMQNMSISFSYGYLWCHVKLQWGESILNILYLYGIATYLFLSVRWSHGLVAWTVMTVTEFLLENWFAKKKIVSEKNKKQKSKKNRFRQRECVWERGKRIKHTWNKK